MEHGTDDDGSSGDNDIRAGRVGTSRWLHLPICTCGGGPQLMIIRIAGKPFLRRFECLGRIPSTHPAAAAAATAAHAALELAQELGLVFAAGEPFLVTFGRLALPKNGLQELMEAYDVSTKVEFYFLLDPEKIRGKQLSGTSAGMAAHWPGGSGSVRLK